MTSSQPQPSTEQKLDSFTTAPASDEAMNGKDDAPSSVHAEASAKAVEKSEPDQSDALAEGAESDAPERVDPPAPEESKVPEYLTHYPGWSVFASTFVTIFLAEIGDKTQVTTLLMTAESHQPWVVFVGAATALVLTSLLGVLLGQWLARRLSPKVLEISAGTALLGVAITLAWDLWQG